MATNFTPIDPDLIKKHPAASSGSLKESEPIVSSAEKYKIDEAVEHEVDEEVRPYVEIKPQTIELPPDLQRLGLQPVSSTVFQSYQNIKLPLSDDKIVVGLHASVASSFRWLATWAFYLLQRAHLGLKVVHGKVIRVLRR